MSDGIRELLKQFQAWLSAPCDTPIVTNGDFITRAGDDGYIHKSNLPSAERLAMFVSFAMHKALHPMGTPTMDAQCPFGGSWGEFYKRTAAEALKPHMVTPNETKEPS